MLDLCDWLGVSEDNVPTTRLCFPQSVVVVVEVAQNSTSPEIAVVVSMVRNDDYSQKKLSTVGL